MTLMETIFLAQIMGIASLIIGLSMILRRQMVIRIFDDLFGSRALTYVLGIAEVICGLIIILNHNVWESALPIVVTFLGWLLFVEGLLYMFAGQKTIKRFIRWLHDQSVYSLIALLYAVIGTYLAYVGFVVGA